MKLLLSAACCVAMGKMESDSLPRYSVEGLEAKDASCNRGNSS